MFHALTRRLPSLTLLLAIIALLSLHGAPTAQAQSTAPPTISGVVPGDGQLTVNYAATGTDTRVVEIRWRVKSPQGSWQPSETGDLVDGQSQHVITGLTNGVTYQVQIRSTDATTQDRGPSTWVQSEGTPAFWTATLTPKDVGGNAAGCDSTSATDANKCSTAATLSDNDFVLDGTTYTITQLWVRGTALNMHVSPSVPDALRGYTLRAGSATLPMADASGFGGTLATWSTGAPTFTVGTPVTVSLSPSRPPGAPAGVVVAEEDRQLTVVWTAPTDAGDSAISGYDVQYKQSSALDREVVFWSATLAVQEVASGTLGCHDSVSGKECNVATTLTANEFPYDGVTYQVIGFSYDTSGQFVTVRLNKSFPAGSLDAVRLVVVEGSDRVVLRNPTLQENSVPRDTLRFSGSLALSAGDDIALELARTPDPSLGWVDAGHTGTTASAVIGGSIWTSTLTVGTAGLSEGIGCGGTLCAVDLSDDDYVYGGTTYDVNFVQLKSNGDLTIGHDGARAFPAGAEAWVLSVDGVSFKFSDATFNSARDQATWSNTGLSWADQDSVKLELRTAPLKAFTRYDVRVRAKSSVGAGPWSAVASGTPSGPVRVQFNPTAYTAPEGGVARIAFETLDEHPDSDVSVQVTATAGTATATTDYAAGPWTVTFPAGVNFISIDIPIVRDTVSEPGGETFTLAITPGTGYTPTGGPATVTIVDVLWGVVMDAGNIGSGALGCDNDNTADASKCTHADRLSVNERTFTLDGTTYTIKKISLNNGTLVFGLTTNIPGALEEGYALHLNSPAVGETKLDLDDATVSGGTATWTNTGITWSQSDDVVMSLQALPQTQNPWSATLTPQALTGGALGCNNALPTASDKCTTTATLSDDDFLVDGTVYSVAVVFVGTGRLGFGLTVNIPDALKTGYSLTVDGSKFALADAGISGKNAVWISNVPSWTAGTAVTLGMEPAVAAPAIDRIIAGHEKLTVRYTLVAGTEAGKIRWRVKSPQGSWQPSDAGEALTAPSPHVITGLTNGETYQVQINAVKGAASSGWSRILEDAPEVGSVPSKPILSLSARANTITASWSAPREDGGTAVTGYDVQYKETAGTSWTDVTHTGTGTTATISGVTGGTSYDVRVRARNAVGAGLWSNVVSVTPGVVTVPGAVGALSAVPGTGRLTVSWRPPASDGGADISGYDLEYKLGTAADQAASTPGDPNTGWVASAHTPGTTSVELTGLTNGVAYDVRVRAKNSAGAGAWSLRSVAPRAPTGERPRAFMATTAYTVAESGPTVRIGINLSIVPSSDVTVTVVTHDGTAKAGEDFTGGPYSVTIPANSHATNFAIPITSDSVAEGHEHFYVSVRQVARVIPGRTVTYGGETYTIRDAHVYDYFLGSPGTARVTITDAYPDPRQDDPFQLQLTPGLDGEGAPIITASWTAPSPAPAHYDIWYEPVDARGPVTYRSARTVYPDPPKTRQVAGNATSVALEGLENGRHYFVRLRSVTSQGYGPWNEQLAGVAGVPAPRWSAEPGAADGSPAIIFEHQHDASFAYYPGYGGHIIQIRKAGTWDWEDWPELSTSAHGLPQGVVQAGEETTWTGGKRTTFKGFQSGFPYMVRLYAVLDGNVVSMPTTGSRIVTWTVPGAPEGLNATGGHKDGEILVTWSPGITWHTPIHIRGDQTLITGWDLQYVKSGSGQGWSDGPYLWPERTRALLTGLEEGASYDLRLRAKSEVGDGPWATVMFDPNPCVQTLPGDGAVNGEWAAGCINSVNIQKYARFYVFTLAQSSEVTLTLESADISTEMYLKRGANPRNLNLVNAFGSPGVTTTTIQRTLAAGTYTVEATTFSGGNTGDFTLTVSGVGPQPAHIPLSIPLPTAMTMSIDDDPQRTTADSTEGWALEGRVHARLLFTLDSPAPAGGTTITFTRGGTARFGDKAGTTGDYYMEEDSVTVPQGELTSSSLYIFFHDDAVEENDETIILNARSDNPEGLTGRFTITIFDNDAPPLQSPGPGIPDTPDGLTATAQILGISTGHATDPLRHELVMRWTPPFDGDLPTYYQPAWQRVFDDGATVQVMTEWQEQADGEGVGDAEHIVALDLTLDDRFNTYDPPLGGHRLGTDVSAHYHYDLTVRACNEAGCSAYAPVLTVKAAKPGAEVEVPQGQRQGPPEPQTGPPEPGQLEPYNVQVTPGDGTLTVRWNVAPREGFEDGEIRHALRWSQVSGVWANPHDPRTGSQNDGLSVEGGVTSYTITGLENGLATGVFVRSFTGGDYSEGSAESSQWVRVKGEHTTPKAAQQQQQQAAAKTYSVSATAAAAEGSDATLTITLSEAAPADGVAFTLTAGYSGQTAETADVGSITSPVTVTAGSSTLSIAIPTADDDVDEEEETFSVTVAAATAGWEKEGDGKDTATVTIQDDDSAGVTVTPTTLNISEDGSGTYTVVLNSQPADDVYLWIEVSETDAVGLDIFAPAFTPETWNQAQTITVSGLADDDSDDESATISHEALSADGQYNGIAIAAVSVAVADTTATNYSISATAAAAEGTDATLTLTLSAAAPADGVAFTLTAGYDGASTATAQDVGAITSPVTVTAGSSSLALAIPTVGDDVDEEDETFTVVVAASTAGWEKAGDGQETATVTIEDDDSAGVTVTPTTLNVSEGGSATYTVVLASKPTADVTVTPTSGDEGAASFAPASYTFTPADWNSARTFTVSGLADDDAEDAAVTISHAALSADAGYNDIAVASVAVAVADSTPTSYSVSATASATEGTDATLTLTLSAAAPQGGVAFTLTAGYDGASTATADDVGSITSPVTVTAGSSSLALAIPTVDDAVDEEEETFTVTVAAATAGWEKAGDGKETATVTIQDDDSAGVTVTPTTLNISEGGSATYTVVLDSKPTADVTITPTSGDEGAASFAPASYTFTPADWNSARTFTVSGLADDDAEDATVTISHAALSADAGYNEIAVASVAVTVADSTPTNFSISATASAAEGTDATLTVTLSASAPGGGAAFGVSADFSGSADANDAGSIPMTVTVAAGEKRAALTIPIAEDELTEEEEVFTVTLTPPAGWSAAAAGDDTATVTISDVAPRAQQQQQGRPEPPGPVVNPQLLGAADSLTVSWQTPASGGAPDNYIVHLKPADGGKGRVKRPQADRLSFTFKNLESGATYAVSVRAENAAGKGERANACITLPESRPEGDPPPARTFSVCATAAAAEGGNAALTVTLSEHAPAEGVAFTVTAGYDGSADSADVGGITSPVTIVEGNSALAITVPIADDAVDEGEESFSVTVAATTAGWVKAGDGRDTATVTIQDDDSAGVTVNPTALNISEGGSATYTVVLDSKPTHDVTVTPTSGDEGAASFAPASYTFTPSDWNSARTFTVSGAADDDAEDESVTISHAALSADAGYNEIAVASVAVTVADTTPTNFSISGTAAAAEGQEAVLTVTLSASAPGGGLAFGVSADFSGSADANDAGSIPQTVRVAAGARTATLTIPIAADALAEKDEVFTVTLTPPAGWTAAAAGDATATVTIIRTYAVSATAAAAEGTDATLTVSLSEAAPANGVQFTVSAGYGGSADSADVGSITSPVTVTAGATTLEITVPIADDAVDEEAETFSVTVAAATAGWLKAGDGRDTATITISDDDSAGVTVNPTALKIAEDGSATYTVLLDSQPTHDVTVTPTASDGGAASFAPASYIFTPSDWNRARSFTVSGVADDDYDDESVTISHGVASGDGNYNDIAAAAVSVAVADTTPPPQLQAPAPARTYAVSATAAAAEGGRATLTVSLSEAAPAEGVQFTVSAGYGGGATATAADVGSITSPVNVTAGSSALDISIPIAQDAVDEDDETFSVTVAAATAGWVKAGDGQDTATVTISDDDSAGVTVSPTALNISEDGSATYTVVLNSQPTADVTVTPTASDGGAARFTPASYTFTPSAWNRAQTFTVSGVADDDSDDESVTISHGVASGDGNYNDITSAAAVSVAVADSTPQAARTYSITAVAGATEGGNATLTVTLGAAAPAGGLALTVTAGYDGGSTATAEDVGGITSPVTVTAGSSTLAIAIPTVGDAVDEEEETFTVTVAATTEGWEKAGDGQDSATVTIQDDDSAGVTVSPTALNISEGGSATYTVVLDSRPTADVTVTPTASDGGAASFAPASYTFTPSDWNRAQTFTVSGVADADTDNEAVTISHGVASGDGNYNGISAAAVSVTVADTTPQAARTYSITDAAAAAEGTDATLTVTLSEAAPAGGVQFTVTAGYDGGATATAEDVGSITSPVSVAAGGTSLSIAIPTVGDAVDEEDETFTVTIAATTAGWEKAGDGQDTATVTISDDDSAGVTVTPTTLNMSEGGSATYTVVLTSRSTVDVTVMLTASDGGAVSFAPASYIFTPSGWNRAQTFTVSGLADDDYDDESVTISHVVVSTDSSYHGIAADSVAVSVSDSTPPPAGEPPPPGPIEPANVQVTPGDGTLTVSWTVTPRDGIDDNGIRHALRWSQAAGVWANPTDPKAVGPNDGISVEGGVASYTITGLQNGVATGVFVRSFTGGNYMEGGPQSSQWVRVKGDQTTPRADQQ